jgi:uncharacterized protein with HEPN domain
MNQRTLKRLFDALDSAEAALELVQGKTLADYHQLRWLRSAVERELEKTGEALFVARRDVPEIVERVGELHQIIGLRHRIVHGYDKLNNDQVWSIAVEAIPRLIDDLRGILNQEGDIPV